MLDPDPDPDSHQCGSTTLVIMDIGTALKSSAVKLTKEHSLCLAGYPLITITILLA
jgi:hypothetical protein